MPPTYILLLFLLQLLSTASQQPQIPGCSLSKKQLIQRSLKYARQVQIEKKIQNEFPAQKYLISKAFYTHNFTLFKEAIVGKEGRWIVHLVFMAIFTILCLVLIPVLFFTRCCKRYGRCRVWEEKGVEVGYSTLGQKIPVIILFCFIVFFIGITIMVLKQNYEFESRYNQFKCSTKLITSDLLDGGQYAKLNIKFIGLNKYNKTLSNFLQKQSTSQTKIKTLQKRSPLNNIKQYIQYINSTIYQTDRRTNSPTISFLRYRKPLTKYRTYIRDFGNNHTYVTSTFKSVLGHTSLNNSLIFNVTQALRKISESVQGIGRVFQEVGGREVSDSRGVMEKVGEMIRGLVQFQGQIDSTFSLLQQGVLKVYTIAIYVVGALGLVIVGGLVTTVIFLFWKRKDQCKIGVAIMCGLVWVLGLLHLGVTFAYIIGNPMVHYGCQFMRQSFSSQTKFNQNILALQPENPNLQLFSKCLLSSKNSKQLLRSLLPPPTPLTNFSSTFSSPISLSSSTLNNTYFTFINEVNDYRYNRKLDIADPQMIQQLKMIAQPTQCMPDSWIPSLHQKNNTIQCTYKNISSKSDADSCQNIANFLSRSKNCQGCMDMSQISQMLTLQRKFYSDLKQRYKQCLVSKQGTQKLQQLNSINMLYYNQKYVDLSFIQKNVLKAKGYVRECVHVLGNVMEVYGDVVDWVGMDEVLGLMELEEYGLLGNSTIYQNKTTQLINIKQTQTNTTTNITNSTTPNNLPPSQSQSPPPIATQFANKIQKLKQKSSTDKKYKLKDQIDCRVVGYGLLLSTNALCDQGILYVYYMRYYYAFSGALCFIVALISVWVVTRYQTQRFFQLGLHVDLNAVQTASSNKQKTKEGNFYQTGSLPLTSTLNKDKNRQQFDSNAPSSACRLTRKMKSQQHLQQDNDGQTDKQDGQSHLKDEQKQKQEAKQKQKRKQERIAKLQKLRENKEKQKENQRYKQKQKQKQKQRQKYNEGDGVKQIKEQVDEIEQLEIESNNPTVREQIVEIQDSQK